MISPPMEIDITYPLQILILHHHTIRCIGICTCIHLKTAQFINRTKSLLDLCRVLRKRCIESCQLEPEITLHFTNITN